MRLIGMATGLLTTLALVAVPTAVAADTGVAASSASHRAAAKPRITASAAVPGRGGFVHAAATRSGKFLFISGPRGLTKYRITPHRIVRLGTAPQLAQLHPTPHPFVLHANGEFAYMPHEVGDHVVLRVIDLRRDTPRLVRSVRVPSATYFTDVAISPRRGRFLYVLVEGGIRRFQLEVPGFPEYADRAPIDGRRLAVRPPLGNELAVGDTSSETTPDGEVLRSRLSGHETDDAALTTVAEAPLTVAGREDEDLVVLDLMFSPRGASIYVTLLGQPSACEGECGELDRTSILRFRTSGGLAPKEVITAKHEFALEGMNAKGTRLYGIEPATTWPSNRDATVVWYDAHLRREHRLTGFRAAETLTVSQRGDTRNLVYVVYGKGKGLRVSSVRVP
ncbi:hypothetical protein [Nocardioides conyzicola]|uniref:Uncharacterized protein n=1 Tax=Nocardioides conyzicola TaxID=1651781 RepID=A0ABP8Y053_9ACTN